MNPKENSLSNAGEPVVTNLSSLPTLPSLNKTAVHINNSNTAVKLGEEVKATLLNHHTATQSLNTVSLQTVVSSIPPSQHGGVLITKQEGNNVFPKTTIADLKAAMPIQMPIQAISNLVVISTAAVMSLSSRTITTTPTPVSVVSSVPLVTSIGQMTTISDPNSLLGKRPRQNLVKTEEGTQAQQTTLPVLVSGCFIKQN